MSRVCTSIQVNMEYDNILPSRITAQNAVIQLALKKKLRHAWEGRQWYVHCDATMTRRTIYKTINGQYTGENTCSRWSKNRFTLLQPVIASKCSRERSYNGAAGLFIIQLPSPKFLVFVLLYLLCCFDQYRSNRDTSMLTITLCTICNMRDR